MKKPTLSVIMANYNYGQYIGEALEAILNQSYRPYEVIIVDDASTDNSIEIIKGLQKKHPNIRLLQNESNMGGIYSINQSLKEVKGEYVYSAGSDDKVLPGFFEKSMHLLVQYPQAGLCFSDWAMIENNKMIENKAYLSDIPRYFSPEEFVKILLKNEFTVIGGISVIVKRADLIEAGGYLPELRSSCDIFAHHVIGFRYGVCYVPEISAVLRKHENQYSAKKFRPLNVELEMVRSAVDIVLTPKYSDVLLMFKRTTPFSHSSWDVLNLVLSNKKYRGFLSIKLLRFALFDKLIRRILLRIFPISFWRGVLDKYKYLKFNLARPIKGNN